MDESQRTADHAGSASAAVSSPEASRGPSAVAPASASVETRPRKDRFLRNCKVCVSANIADVEQMASVGVEATIIGRRFGIPHNSVRRHVRNHISVDRWARLQGSYFGRDDVDTASKLKELGDRERDGLLLRLSIQRSDLNALTKNEDPRVAVAAHNALIRLHEMVGRCWAER